MKSCFRHFLSRLHRSRALRLELSAVLGLVAAVAVSSVAAAAEQRALASKLIRFHVVAASDSETDQAQKLLVRDRLLSAIAQMELSDDRDEAAAVLQCRLDDLRVCAETVLAEAGAPQPVTVTLARERFPTREYDHFSLPAGSYLSLRVVIGDGVGHNWWCVLFPPLCTSDAALRICAEDGYLTGGEYRLMTGNAPDVVYRFRLLELWNRLIDLF